MIVITCPNGNVGSEVAQRLAAQPALPWRGIGRNESAFRQRFGAQAPFVQFDYTDHESWDAALANIQVLLLILPAPTPRHIERDVKPFLRAAIAKGCHHIVYLSVPAAADNPAVPHNITERFIKSLGVNYTLLRAGYFMQNFTRPEPTHVDDIRDRDQLYVPLGNSRHQLIDTRDIGLAAFNIMRDPARHANQAYKLVAQACDMNDVAAAMSRELGRTIVYSNPKLPKFCFTLWRRGVRFTYVIAMGFVYNMLRGSNEGEVINDELSPLLERAPLTLADFVRDYRQAWQK